MYIQMRPSSKYKSCSYNNKLKKATMLRFTLSNLKEGGSLNSQKVVRNTICFKHTISSVEHLNINHRHYWLGFAMTEETSSRKTRAIYLMEET